MFSASLLCRKSSHPILFIYFFARCLIKRVLLEYQFDIFKRNLIRTWEEEDPPPPNLIEKKEKLLEQTLYIRDGFSPTFNWGGQPNRNMIFFALRHVSCFKVKYGKENSHTYEKLPYLEAFFFNRKKKHAKFSYFFAFMVILKIFSLKYNYNSY